MMMIVIMTTIMKRFPVHDKLGTCMTSLVSPEQPVLCPARGEEVAAAHHASHKR